MLPLPIEYLVVFIILSFFLAVSIWAGLKVLECESVSERCEGEGLTNLAFYWPAFVVGFAIAIYFVFRYGRKARKLKNF